MDSHSSGAHVLAEAIPLKDAAPEQPPKLPALKGNIFKLADHARNVWRIYPPTGSRPESFDDCKVTVPDKGIKALDLAELLVDGDGGWFRQYLVVDAGLGWIHLRQLVGCDLPPRVVRQSRWPDTHEPVNAPASEGHGFIIRRKSDNMLLRNDGGGLFESEDAALRHLLNHVSMQRR